MQQSMRKFEEPLIEAFKREHELEQLLIFCNSGSVTEERQKQIDLANEDICWISHFSQCFFAAAHMQQGSRKLDANAFYSMPVQDLLHYYISLERTFMADCVSRIISTDSEALMGRLTLSFGKKEGKLKDISTLNDEVFYVYRNCALRALYSLNMGTSCAIVNIVIDNLKEVLFPQLKERLSSLLSQGKTPSATFPQRFKDALGFQTKFTLSNTALILTLNMLHTASLYVGQLCKYLSTELESLMEESLGLGEADEGTGVMVGQFFNKEMFVQSLEFLKQAKEEADLFLRDELKGILSQKEFRIFIDALHQELAAVRLDLSKNDFEEYEVNEPFFPRFCRVMQKTLVQWQEQMEEGVFDLFVDAFVGRVSQRLTAAVLGRDNGGITLLGSLYLDKLSRNIVSFLQTKTNKPIRKYFSRFLDTVQVLAFENREELVDFLNIQQRGLPSQKKKLTFAEITEILEKKDDYEESGFKDIIISYSE